MTIKMMRKTMKVWPLIILFFSLPSFSWEEDFIKKAQELEGKFLEKQNKIREKVKESLELKAEMFGGFEEKLEKFMDRMGTKFFDNFFNDDFFKDDFFKDGNLLGRMKKSYAGHWKETSGEVIFVLKAETKRPPLNINIKDGLLKIEGDLIEKFEKVDEKGTRGSCPKELLE